MASYEGYRIYSIKSVSSLGNCIGSHITVIGNGMHPVVNEMYPVVNDLSSRELI